ncbi:MAG: hypothetical protein QM796_01610 [Chthoniobacteraceae bacterium]
MNTPFEIAAACLSSNFDLFAAGIAGVMVAGLTAFFRFTRIGLGLPRGGG